VGAGEVSDTIVAPTESEWQALYGAANAFKELAPWEWMLDSDIFGVRNPESGEIGYCCVMGNLGEHLALAIYRGAEGLRSLVRIQAGEYWPPDLGALFIQNCLSASFEDRDLLSKQDRDLIKALGLRYRGRQAWPLFRDYTPGYVPWYLEGSGARFLAVGLEQAMEVARRFRDDPELLDPPADGQLLLRVLENGTWQDSWHIPELFTAAPASPPEPRIDELRLHRIAAKPLRRGGRWQSDCFRSSQGVQDKPGQRPYYPMVSLFVDEASGMILPTELFGPENWQDAYGNHLLNMIEQMELAPKEIAVQNPELRDLLTPLARTLGIKVSMSRQLPSLEEARHSLLMFFDSR
jgi:hypothetical protein